MRKKKNTHEHITERIIELLEAGTCPWRRPWSQLNIRPQNFQSGRAYSGINLFLLSSMGFEVPVFMTFEQVKERGGQIIKGSKGLPVVYWGIVEVEDRKKNADETKLKSIPFLRHYTVFNACQIDGIEFPKPTPATHQEFDPIEKAEAIMSDWQDCPTIEHGFGRACYALASDLIQMPSKTSFLRSAEYYSTLFHEAAHATGHESRLKRDMIASFGTKSYSKEELIAEMTSAFLCAECGIDNHVIENQAAYLQSWLDVLKEDSKLIVMAASAAQKATNFILGRIPSDREKAAA